MRWSVVQVIIRRARSTAESSVRALVLSNRSFSIKKKSFWGLCFSRLRAFASSGVVLAEAEEPKVSNPSVYPAPVVAAARAISEVELSLASSGSGYGVWRDWSFSHCGEGDLDRIWRLRLLVFPIAYYLFFLVYLGILAE
jgi:hypothetical protein